MVVNIDPGTITPPKLNFMTTPTDLQLQLALAEELPELIATFNQRATAYAKVKGKEILE